MQHIELLSLFSIALFASLSHCVGMCGGIVLAYSSLISQKSLKNAPNSADTKQDLAQSTARDSKIKAWLKQILLHLSYHSGKIATYTALGCIFGALGSVAAPSEEAKYIILALVGAVLVLFGIANLNLAGLSAFFKKTFGLFAPKPLHSFLALMRPLLLKPSLSRIFTLGLLNGLLPCGIVYYFLLSASVAGSALNGGIVMLVFGIATIPSLFILGVFSSSLINSKRVLFLRLCALLMIGFGIFEIYKALRFLAS